MQPVVQINHTVVSLKIQRIFKNIISVSPNFGILDRELSSLFSRSITHHGIIGIVNITAGKLTFNIHRKQEWRSSKRAEFFHSVEIMSPLDHGCRINRDAEFLEKLRYTVEQFIFKDIKFCRFSKFRFRQKNFSMEKTLRLRTSGKNLFYALSTAVMTSREVLSIWILNGDPRAFMKTLQLERCIILCFNWQNCTKQWTYPAQQCELTVHAFSLSSKCVCKAPLKQFPIVLHVLEFAASRVQCKENYCLDGMAYQNWFAISDIVWP